MKNDIDVNRADGDIALQIGEATLIMRAEVAVRILLDKLLQRPAAAAPRARSLPAIGADYQGGKFAGVTLDGDRLAALVLLPGDFSGAWAEAKDWAEKEDGVLPSRHDHLVLFKNLKGEFRGEAYWSCEQHADDASYAWCQSFNDGYQSDNHRGNELRARAVRRLPLE